jgi:hypothetical protein
MTKFLEEDATIADVLPTLTNKEEYVRVVFGNMAECKRRFGNASVRIGIAGDGKAPYHRVSYRNSADVEIPFGAFVGKNPFKNEARVHDDTWSSVSVTMAEIQALMGELRHFEIKSPPKPPAPPKHAKR